MLFENTFIVAIETTYFSCVLRAKHVIGKFLAGRWE